MGSKSNAGRRAVAGALSRRTLLNWLGKSTVLALTPELVIACRDERLRLLGGAAGGPSSPVGGAGGFSGTAGGSPLALGGLANGGAGGSAAALGIGGGGRAGADAGDANLAGAAGHAGDGSAGTAGMAPSGAAGRGGVGPGGAAGSRPSGVAGRARGGSAGEGATAGAAGEGGAGGGGAGLSFQPGPDPTAPSGRWYVNTVDSQNLIDILATWELTVDGMVENPVTLTFADLLELARTDQLTDFHCVEGWSVRDVPWNGVHLSEIVRLVQPVPEATHLTFHCFGGVYNESLPWTVALEPRTLLAYGVDGATLPLSHGFPLRVVVPRLFGYKNAKYVQRIEFTDHAVEGYWVRRGYSYEAEVQPSRLRPDRY